MTTVSRVWTITTWNVQGNRRPDPEALADAIRGEAPDVLAVQEVRPAMAARLADALGMRHSWTLKHYPYTPLFPSAAEGLAICSPHEMSSVDHAVVSSSRSTWTFRRRIVQTALVSRPDSSAYRIFHTHLSSGDAADARRTEAERIATIAARLGDAPQVTAGDLNDGVDGSVVALLPGCEPVRPPFTNPSQNPTQTLDHVLVPADAYDVTVTVPPAGSRWAALSDHLPLTVRFALDWVAGDFT